jgi:hypothetical protein
MGATKKARQSSDETAEGAGDKLKTKDYEHALARLHVELVRLQQWVVYKGLKICIAFEGRDGAGKAGVIVTFDRAGTTVPASSGPDGGQPAAELGGKRAVIFANRMAQTRRHRPLE